MYWFICMVSFVSIRKISKKGTFRQYFDHKIHDVRTHLLCEPTVQDRATFSSYQEPEDKKDWLHSQSFSKLQKHYDFIAINILYLYFDCKGTAKTVSLQYLKIMKTTVIHAISLPNGYIWRIQQAKARAVRSASSPKCPPSFHSNATRETPSFSHSMAYC